MDRGLLNRWMDAAAAGDRAAVEPLFHALWPVVSSYAQRLLGGDRALAEDVAQESLVRLFRQLPRYESGRDALTWALTIATWQCRTARRAIQRRGEVAAVASDELVDGVQTLEDRALVRTALAALAELAPRDLEVLAAAILDDEELRASLAPATFRKRLERALGRLRLSWRNRHGEI